MANRTELEDALLTHGPKQWSAADRGTYADDLITTYGDGLAGLDAAGFAHCAWTMGATADHEGHCRYRDEDDAHDGDGSNECASCEQALTEVGRKVLADLDPTDSETETEKSN